MQTRTHALLLIGLVLMRYATTKSVSLDTTSHRKAAFHALDYNIQELIGVQVGGRAIFRALAYQWTIIQHLHAPQPAMPHMHLAKYVYLDQRMVYAQGGWILCVRTAPHHAQEVISYQECAPHDRIHLAPYVTNAALAIMECVKTAKILNVKSVRPHAPWDFIFQARVMAHTTDSVLSAHPESGVQPT